MRCEILDNEVRSILCYLCSLLHRPIAVCKSLALVGFARLCVTEELKNPCRFRFPSGVEEGVD